MSPLRSLLPGRGGLSESGWLPRHRLVCAVLAAHVVGLTCYALLAIHPDGVGSAGTGLAAFGLVVALTATGRRTRSLAATVGLLACSATLVQLSHGSAVVHAHYVLAVALTALYEDWATYAVALVLVLGWHAGIAALHPGQGVADDRQALLSSVIDAILILSASLTQVILWFFARQSREHDPAYRHELAELDKGRSRVEDRLKQLETTREDLLATVSHEFRTPLTAIQGAAMTLRKHRARLPETRVDEMLDAVMSNTERLGRLLENMLTAAEARAPDRKAVTDVHQVATQVAELVESAHAQRAPSVVVAVDEGLEARVEGSALYQILANLLDNAIVHAQPGSHAIVSGAVEADDIVVTVANEAEGVDAQMLAELFEPFTQRDSSSTRSQEGAGVGLYVVRRLVEVSLGSLSVRSQPGWVSIEVRLPRAPEHTVDLTAADRYAER